MFFLRPGLGREGLRFWRKQYLYIIYLDYVYDCQELVQFLNVLSEITFLTSDPGFGIFHLLKWKLTSFLLLCNQLSCWISANHSEIWRRFLYRFQEFRKISQFPVQEKVDQKKLCTSAHLFRSAFLEDFEKVCIPTFNA